MHRQEGLFQRRNVQTSVAAAKSEDTTRVEPETDERRRTNDANEDVDADSKEARLTLMEEVLLLGLKDKEVKSGCTTAGVRPQYVSDAGRFGRMSKRIFRPIIHVTSFRKISLIKCMGLGQWATSLFDLTFAERKFGLSLYFMCDVYDK